MQERFSRNPRTGTNQPAPAGGGVAARIGVEAAVTESPREALRARHRVSRTSQPPTGDRPRATSVLGRSRRSLGRISVVRLPMERTRNEPGAVGRRAETRQRPRTRVSSRPANVRTGVDSGLPFPGSSVVPGGMRKRRSACRPIGPDICPRARPRPAAPRGAGDRAGSAANRDLVPERVRRSPRRVVACG